MSEQTKETTTLEQLVGPHLLSGVQPGIRQATERYHEDANTLAVVLDGKCWVIVEDPSDGYRSSMQDIEAGDLAEVTNTFKPVRVTAAMRDYSVDDVLEFTDDATGKTVLAIGTANTIDYYPYFVADWMPENLIHNADK